MVKITAVQRTKCELDYSCLPGFALSITHIACFAITSSRDLCEYDATVLRHK